MIATPFNILAACATRRGLRRTISLMKLKLVSPGGHQSSPLTGLIIARGFTSTPSRAPHS